MNLDELNRDFLIIGFTGPHTSGCTEAANFFQEKLSKYKKDYVVGEYDLQDRIIFKYKEIYSLKNSKDNEDALTNKNKELKELLVRREIVEVLSNQRDCSFKKISLSEILFSIIYRNLMKISDKDKFKEELKQELKDEKEATKKIDLILRITDEIYNHRIENDNKADEVEKLLTDKKYDEIDDKFYDNYIESLSRLFKLIRENHSSESNLLSDIFQDFGDNLRKTGNPLSYSSNNAYSNVLSLAKKANLLIKYYRRKKELNHFVIEAFRNPYEVEFFSNRYNEFYLISIVTKPETWSYRSYDKERSKREDGSDNPAEFYYKQNVSRCVYLSDIAITNDYTKKEDLYNKLLWYFALMKKPGCITPTTDEMFMHQAYSMSLKSSCISHQVGAVIIGPNGYIVGAGWNDVGKGQIGCGYRKATDFMELDNNCLVANKNTEPQFRTQLGTGNGCKCFKDEYSEFKLPKKKPEDKLIKRLEYCRALHAEENAIIQGAKIGGSAMQGGTIYTTYFPCELCAKKIYQTGIKKVVYTEPYLNSISKDVFFKDGIVSVKLTQFEGVKSHSYYKLYKPFLDKKDNQQLMGI